MEILDKIEGHNIKNISLALGFFDGVHKAHQTVIKTALENSNKTAVITFKKHPLEIFGKEVKYLNTLEQREKLIEQLGVDYLFELDFSQELSYMSGIEYLKLIVETFRPKKIVTGFNHTFGKNKTGSPQLLSDNQKLFGYTYYQVPPQKIDNEIISSTKIKDYLSKGEIENANKMLGYQFSINGIVIEGEKIGRKIGFPTANVMYPDSIVNIPYGVYKTQINSQDSITNYGIKPTITNKNQPIIESHILNFSKNIYNTNIAICFNKKIRNEKKFNSLEDLKIQIDKDIVECSR